MRTILIILTAIYIGSSCNNNSYNYISLNVLNDTSFLITSEIKHPYMIFFSIEGEVDGQFNINGLPFSAGEYKHHSFRLDWYTDSAWISYTPYNVTKGNLKISAKLY